MNLKIVMRMTAAAAACIITAAAAAGCAAPGGGQAQADQSYEPALEITGDIQNVMSLKPDGSGAETAAEKAEAAGGDRSGWRLKDIAAEAQPYSEDSAVYLQGWDGMMASIRLDELDANWLVFGTNGWECISDGYPESLGVKEIRRVIIAADDPADVPSSVKVMADDGIERVLSPGSLYINDYVSSVEWQGDSDKNGNTVSVLLTDSYTQVGDKKLKPDGNKIVTEQ